MIILVYCAIVVNEKKHETYKAAPVKKEFFYSVWNIVLNESMVGMLVDVKREAAPSSAVCHSKYCTFSNNFLLSVLQRPQRWGRVYCIMSEQDFLHFP